MSDKIKITELSYEIWKKDLNLFNYSLFITPEWTESVSDTLHTPIYLNFIINKKIVGKIAGLIVKNKKIGYSLYFYSGPALLNLNENLYNDCLDSIFSFAKNNSFSMIKIDDYDNKYSIKYSGNNFFITKSVEFIVPLNKGLDNIKIKKRFLRNVKKSKGKGLIIKESNDPTKINILLKLLESTKQKRIKKYNEYYNPFYLINLNKNSIKKLLKSRMALFVYTEINNSVDCMELILKKGNSIYMLLKGTNKNGYKKGLPSLINYYIIKKYSNAGFSTYNLGGRVPGKGGDGLEIYKKSMGAEKVIVYGASTQLLTFPLKLLNPLFYLLQKLPRNHPVVKYIAGTI